MMNYSQYLKDLTAEPAAIEAAVAPGAEEPGPLQPADEDDPPALPDE